MNPKQLHILQHSLGVDQYGQGAKYRNRFVTDADSPDGRICQELCDLGWMHDSGAQAMAGGMHCYFVTEWGMEAMHLHSPAKYLTFKRVKP